MITSPVSDRDLIKAIELRISKCFVAMDIANALGGSQSIPWDIARKYSVMELVAEALDRKLDVCSIKAAVDGTSFMDTEMYSILRDKWEIAWYKLTAEHKDQMPTIDATH